MLVGAYIFDIQTISCFVRREVPTLTEIQCVLIVLTIVTLGFFCNTVKNKCRFLAFCTFVIMILFAGLAIVPFINQGYWKYTPLGNTHFEFELSKLDGPYDSTPVSGIIPTVESHLDREVKILFSRRNADNTEKLLASEFLKQAEQKGD